MDPVVHEHAAGAAVHGGPAVFAPVGVVLLLPAVGARPQAPARQAAFVLKAAITCYFEVLLVQEYHPNTCTDERK